MKMQSVLRSFRYLFRFCFMLLTLSALPGWGAPRVMNPGEAKGQLVHLSLEDILQQTPKYKSISPLSIPVFAELPMDLAVVGGAITRKQQNLLSHVQIKSRARKTPNLDISDEPEFFTNGLMKNFKDGDWIYLVLGPSQEIRVEASSEAAALDFNREKIRAEVFLTYDLSVREIFESSRLSWRDAGKVGAKAANYAELGLLLNTPERLVVRPGFAIPFFFYQEFIDLNPEIKKAIDNLLRDPLMNKISRIQYREQKLKALSALMMRGENIVNPKFVDDLIAIFDEQISEGGKKRNMKLRSSTNSEDLPNFNGAGLYESASYKPMLSKEVEKSQAEKQKSLRTVLQTVWSSVWSLRAFEERSYFNIPHGDVKMGIQVNPSFSKEAVDGVVVSKNIAGVDGLAGAGVYIEAQRGDIVSVANPAAGAKPEKTLVLYDVNAPLLPASFQVHVLQKSNVADDNETILERDNPAPVMSDAEVKDLTRLVLMAHAHFKGLYGAQNSEFSLDLEFKVAFNEAGARQVYIKQARPYIE